MSVGTRSDDRWHLRISPWVVAFGMGALTGVVFAEAGDLAFLLGIPLAFIATATIVKKVRGRNQTPESGEANPLAEPEAEA